MSYHDSYERSSRHRDSNARRPYDYDSRQYEREPRRYPDIVDPRQHDYDSDYSYGSRVDDRNTRRYQENADVPYNLGSSYDRRYRDDFPTPPPPSDKVHRRRSTRQRADTHRRRKWPPDPFVEEEIDSLAREFGNLATRDDDYIPNRGAPDQEDLLEDVEVRYEDNNEDRFTVLNDPRYTPDLNSSSEEFDKQKLKEEFKARKHQKQSLHIDVDADEPVDTARRAPSPYAFTPRSAPSKESSTSSKWTAADSFLSPEPMTPAGRDGPFASSLDGRNPMEKAVPKAAEKPAQSTKEGAGDKGLNVFYDSSDEDSRAFNGLLREKRPARYSFNAAAIPRDDLRAALNGEKKPTSRPGTPTSSRQSSTASPVAGQPGARPERTATMGSNRPQHLTPDSRQSSFSRDSHRSAQKAPTTNRPPSPPRSPRVSQRDFSDAGSRPGSSHGATAAASSQPSRASSRPPSPPRTSEGHRSFTAPHPSTTSASQLPQSDSPRPYSNTLPSHFANKPADSPRTSTLPYPEDHADATHFMPSADHYKPHVSEPLSSTPQMPKPTPSASVPPPQMPFGTPPQPRRGQWADEAPPPKPPRPTSAAYQRNEDPSNVYASSPARSFPPTTQPTPARYDPMRPAEQQYFSSANEWSSGSQWTTQQHYPAYGSVPSSYTSTPEMPQASSFPVRPPATPAAQSENRLIWRTKLPTCSRRELSTRHNDWYALRNYKSFAICPDCFDGVFAGTIFAASFAKAERRSTSTSVKCELGSDPWYRTAWLLTAERKLKDLRLFEELALLAEETDECPGNDEVEHSWYGLADSRGDFVSNFYICPYDVRQIVTLLPNMHRVFSRIPQSNSNRRPHKCSFRPLGKDFAFYLDALIQIHDDGSSSSRKQPDMRAFIDILRSRNGTSTHRPSVSAHPSTNRTPTAPRPQPTTTTKYESTPSTRCARDTMVYDQPWHYLPSLPHFTVCEDCFDNHIRPLLSTGSSLATSFNRKATYLPNETFGTSCQLYSPRMQSVWAWAVKMEDWKYLEGHVELRWRRERELQAKHRTLKQMLDGAVRHEQSAGMNGGWGAGGHAAGGQSASSGIAAQMSQLIAEWRAIE